MAGMNSVVTSPAILSAYQNGQNLSLAKTDGTSNPDTSFVNVLGAAVSNVAGSVREADKTALAGLKGEISTQQVVEATMELETNLRVAVSVRDKVVQAYQEILRMPI